MGLKKLVALLLVLVMVGSGMAVAANIFILSIFLILSILFGVYTMFTYIVFKRIHKKISHMLPLILTILLPTTYILFTDIFSKATSEYEPLLPVIGYITIVVSFITPASTAAIIPVPLISKLKKGEFFCISCFNVKHLLYTCKWLCRSDGCW